MLFCISMCFFLSTSFYFSNFFFSLWYGSHRDLHSFPTRRSSDLIIQIIGLENAIQAKVKTYSLGMRQRLGLGQDRKSTRLNSSHVAISYAVFCLKKKRNEGRMIELQRTRIIHKVIE